MSARYTSMLLFADLQRQLNRLFDQTVALHRSSLQQSTGWQPKIDVIDHPDQIVVSVEVPGIPREAIEVAISGEILSIRGAKPVPLPDGVQGTFRCVERERGEFERRIQLGRSVDPQESRTCLENGLLSIVLPKLKDRRARTYLISIDTAREAGDE